MSKNNCNVTIYDCILKGLDTGDLLDDLIGLCFYYYNHSYREKCYNNSW